MQKLNDYFEKGWEYVDNISQSISCTGNSYNVCRGEVVIIFQKLMGPNEKFKL